MAGARHRFPLTNQEDYKGTISFTALQERDISASALRDLQAQSRFGTDDLRSQRNRTTDVDAFQGRTGDLEATFSSGRFLGQPGDRSKVTLYLPPQMQFSDGIEYANVDLGAAGAFAERAIREGRSGMGVVGAMLSGALPDIDSVLDAMRGSIGTEAASLAALRTVGRVSETAANVISTTTGVALNPNRRTTLRGVTTRTFNFTFNLIPTTRQEAREIENIVTFFRTEAYPEDIEVGGITVGYKFPNKFRINMQYNGRRVAHGILPCFLQNVNVVYNPNNMSFHKDGAFPETNLSLTFIEERTLRKQDIVGGF